MNQATTDILYKDKDLEISFTQSFDGLPAFKHIHNIMPPVGCVDRVVMNFSNIPRVETPELYYLLAELAADPLFDKIEIDIVGLRGGSMDRTSLTDKEYGSSDAVDAIDTEPDLQEAFRPLPRS